MNNDKKIMAASLISPLAILLIPIVISIYVAYSPSVGPMDDVPTRAAEIILFAVSPVAYFVLALAVFLLTWVLKKLNRFSKQSLSALVVVISITGGVLLGLRSPFGVKDQLIGVAVFSSLFLMCLGSGAIVLWAFAKPPSIIKDKA